MIYLISFHRRRRRPINHLVSFTSHLTSKRAFISLVQMLSRISRTSSPFHMHSHVYWLTNLSCTFNISCFYDCMCLPYLMYIISSLYLTSPQHITYLSCLDRLVSFLCFISLWPISILHNSIVGSKKKKNNPLTPIYYDFIFVFLGYNPKPAEQGWFKSPNPNPSTPNPNPSTPNTNPYSILHPWSSVPRYKHMLAPIAWW